MRDQNKESIRITEGSSNLPAERSHRKLKFENIKKPIIYFLMTFICTGCLYLIFKPSEEKNKIKDEGFNSAIPQAADDKLPSDKQKAYEQQLLEQKNEEKKNVLTNLSDYWNDSASQGSSTNTLHLSEDSGSGVASQNSVNSYRNAQQTLGSFYSRDDQEVGHLKREIHRLKTEASQKNAAPAETTINDQLELMEKSYQMAAKYFPVATKNEDPGTKKPLETVGEENKIKVEVVQSVNHSMISSLYREPSDSLFLSGISNNRFLGVQDAEKNKAQQHRSSIRAVIHETKMMVAEQMLSVRLTESMQIGKIIIPEGTILKAVGKLQSDRLQLKISSIGYEGHIIPVDMTIYDHDGQAGLYIPYSPEQNAVKDIASNMSQNSGTNIMMTQSAGQQVASDLSRGLIQGVSGYFQKKIRTPKVTVKAGHEVFLVSKK